MHLRNLLMHLTIFANAARSKVCDCMVAKIHWFCLPTKLWKRFCCYSGAEQREKRKSVLFRSPTGNKGKQTPSRSAPEASGMQIWVSKSSPFFPPFLHILLLSSSTAPTSSQYVCWNSRITNLAFLKVQSYHRHGISSTALMSWKWP